MNLGDLVRLENLVAIAKAKGASDIHLEAGLPVCYRIRGLLEQSNDRAEGPALLAMARELISPDEWQSFVVRQSFDGSRTIAGVRCRVNILTSARGIGLAVRLLLPFQATIERLNLHPDLAQLANRSHGLVLLSGPTGSGKSTTLAALIQEINLTQAKHVITIEHPVEYSFRPHHALIRQREVGRDTPSFAQALIDALREDPDVIMVGEMRDPETMRLTLNAAETGHLVFATLHASTTTEALQRLVSAFPADMQHFICAQLADCLLAALSQKLAYRPAENLRVPECELLLNTSAVKAVIRQAQFAKLDNILLTGAAEGLWTYQRYRQWLEQRSSWTLPSQVPAEIQPEDPHTPTSLHEAPTAATEDSLTSTPPPSSAFGENAGSPSPRTGSLSPQEADKTVTVPQPAHPPKEHRPTNRQEEEPFIIEIDEDEDLDELLKNLDR